MRGSFEYLFCLIGAIACLFHWYVYRQQCVCKASVRIEDLDGKLGVFEREAELEHLPVNETSQSSDKNYVNGIQNISPGTACQVSTKSAHGCVQTWLYCKFNWVYLMEPQCARQSSGCLPSVTRFGFPKCKPVYKWMQIKLPNGQKKRLKLNTTCVCAWLTPKQ